MIHYICLECKKEFTAGSRTLKRKYCSEKCYGKSKSRKMFGKNHFRWKGGKPNCLDCGKKLSSYGFKRCETCHMRFVGKLRMERTEKFVFICPVCNKKENKTLWHKGKKRFCSRECLKKHANETKQCSHCKKGFTSLKSAKRKFCSNICYNDSISGSNSPAWRGGKSFEPYTPRFNKQLKEVIYARDGFQCKLCGVPQIECIYKLSVHHIDYDKKNLKSNNLITLCKSCHAKTNYSRKQWTEYFTKKLEVNNADKNQQST